MSICTASGDPDTYPQIISDGSGGAIIAWEDSRGGNSDIYAQRVDSNGDGQWSAAGLAICTASGDQFGPQIISDGSGGAIITWQDGRSGNYDVYAQKVDYTGAAQWTPNGVAICTASCSQMNPQIIPDGLGGAIIAWEDYRSSNENIGDVYAQRVDSAGTVQWIANGVAVCTASHSQMNPQITSDGLGGAIITWKDNRGGNEKKSDVYAQRVDSAGAVQWTDNGVAVCTAWDDPYAYPRITTDGSGGAIITCQDVRNGIENRRDIYAQRVDCAGAVQWTDNGVAICTASGNQSSAQVISDGSGGAIIAWDDFRSSSYKIYAQRVNSNGIVQWSPDGEVICSESCSQGEPGIISDGSGGAIITWDDVRSANHLDIYAQRVDSVGAVQWTTNGVAISTASNCQYSPHIASDGAAGAIITWEDYRNGENNFDIYAQRVDSSGNLINTAPSALPSGSTNWWLIVGIVVGVAIVIGVLAKWFVVSRRKT